MGWVAVGIGGMVGAMLRYGTERVLMGSSDMSVRSGDFPWGTLTVNLLGSALLALLLVWTWHSHEPHDTLWLLLAVGLLGSFTTMSTFAVDTVLLGETSAGMVAAYVLATLAGSVGIVWGVWKIAGHALQ